MQQTEVRNNDVGENNLSEKLELFGNIIADAISDDLIYEDDMDSDDPLDLDGYLSDLRPRIVDALQEKWG